MNEKIWHKIMKDYIKSYEAINTLYIDRIIEEDIRVSLNEKLLKDIIVTFESEVEE